MLKPHIPKDITKRSMVPIIIGVTGHRYIERRHEPLIKKVFLEIDRKYPNTPIVVLSPLADGADRLVAQVALDMKRKRSTSLSLICPLPMPREEYENDFDDESKKEFAEMLKKATAWFELPLEVGSTLADIREYGPPRDAQYLSVGKYIARHSHILIALWDGIDNGKVGGTSHIVKERHEGRLKTVQNPLDENDSGPIYHFLTTKVENGDAEIGDRHEIFPGMDLSGVSNDEEFEQKQVNFNRILDRIEAFNTDARKVSHIYKPEIEISRKYVIPKNKRSNLSEFSKRLLHHYAVADTLAIYYQGHFTKTLKTLFGLALAALFFFEVYAHFVPNLPAVLIGYPLILGCALTIFKLAQGYSLQSKYLDYRALAEGLRVQFFWVLSGRNIEVLDYYLPKQKSELDWIKYAVHSLNMPLSETEFTEKTHIEKAHWRDVLINLETMVLEHWVKDQAGYFEGRAPKHKEQVEEYHFYGKVLVVSGVLISSLLIIVQFATQGDAHSGEHHSGSFTFFQHLSISMSAMAIAIAAAVGGYAEKAALSAQANRYFSMSRIFKRAQGKLENLLSGTQLENLEDLSPRRQAQLKADHRAREIREAQELVFELGKAALEENADWLIIRRERELEVPAG